MIRYVSFTLVSILFLISLFWPVDGWSTEKSPVYATFENLVLPLENAPGGKVTLEKGYFVQKSHLHGGSSRFQARIEKVTTSSWKGTKVAALVLAYETGGSGTFRTLFFLSCKNDRWLPKAQAQLGDRIKIHYLSLYRHGLVFVGMLEHGKNDAMCCPNKRTLKVYEISGNILRPSGTYKVDIFPDEIRCDPTLLDRDATLELIPQVSFSPHNQGHAWAIPTHIGLVTRKNKILMRVINIQHYIDLWFKEHDPTINIAVRRLKMALKRQVSSLSAPFDILPPRPGINDFAIFISKIPFKNGTGIGFIGRVVKDLVCIDKSQLRFFYMGLDEGQRYLVTLSLKVLLNKDVPSTLWMCQAGVEGLRKQIDRIEKTFKQMGIDRVWPAYRHILRFISTVEIKV